MKKFLLLGLALFIVSLSAQAQYYSTIYAQTARVDSLVPRGTSGQFGWFTRNVSPHTGAVTLITATDTLRIATGYFTGNATIAGLLNGFTLRQGASLSDTAKFALVISNLADTSKYTEYADTTSLLTNQWRLGAKQNVISNLADTSKYTEYADTTSTIANQWRLGGYYAKGDTAATLASKSFVGNQYIAKGTLGSMSLADSLTYHGNANITTLGTITSGIWNAGAITSSGGVQSTTLTPTGLTTGSLPYKSATTLANSPIYTDGTNVGIGSTAPAEKLEVIGNIISKGTSWTLRTSAADNNWYGVTYGNGLFVAVAYSGTGNRVMTSGKTERNALSHNNIYQGGLSVMGGNVGIGTTSPDEKFEVEWIADGTDVEIGRGTTDIDVTFLTLRSPNGTKYYITVSDAGALSASTTKP